MGLFAQVLISPKKSSKKKLKADILSKHFLDVVYVGLHHILQQNNLTCKNWDHKSCRETNCSNCAAQSSNRCNLWGHVHIERKAHISHEDRFTCQEIGRQQQSSSCFCKYHILSSNVCKNVLLEVQMRTKALISTLFREPLRQKIRDYLGVLPIQGGRVLLNPKTFVILPSNFWHAKIILRC